MLMAKDCADALLGDLREELGELASGAAAPRWPALWLERHVWRHVMAETGFAVSRAGRSLRFVLRDAWRSLRASPRESAFSVLILTLGIGAATVTFSVVDAVVLRPFPVHRIDELAVVTGRTRLSSAMRLSWQEYAALRDRADGFATVGASTNARMSVAIGDERVDLLGARATPTLFDVVGRQPALGQAFGARHASPGADGVVVVGHGLWQRLGGSDDVIGSMLRVDDRPREVLGVMPPGFTFPIRTGDPVRFWVPLVPDEGDVDPARAGRSRDLDVFGRLQPGSTLALAQAQVEAITASLAPRSPRSFEDWQPEVRPMRDALLGDARGWMLLVLWSVVLVMAVACANVANLLLARSSRRARELSVRASLGASRRHLFATLLAESLMLSLTAAGLALVLATWGVDAARAALPSGIVRADAIALDGRVLGIAVAAAVLTGLVFGALPARQAARAGVQDVLKQGSHTIAGHARGRALLLITQVAFVGVLLATTAMFVTSFVRVTTADLGFDRSNLVWTSQVIGYSGTVYDLVDEVARMPGIEAVAAALAAPPLVGGTAIGMQVPVPGDPDGRTVPLQSQRVSPEYFETAGIPILRGRAFLRHEENGVYPVVIDERAAEAFFSGSQPLGRRLDAPGFPRPLQVVGVAANVLVGGPEDPSGPQLYYPIQADPRAPGLLVRTRATPASIMPAIQQRLADLTSPQRRVNVFELEEAFRRLTADRRFNAGLMAIFGILALVIGAAGVYGVMTSLVAQRSRDFGVRLALGATSGRLTREVMGQAGRYVGAGLAAGLAAAWWASRGFASLLFAVEPGEPGIYLVVGAVLAGSGLLAAWLPARRAGRVDPVETLRAE